MLKFNKDLGRVDVGQFARDRGWVVIKMELIFRCT